MACMPPVPVAIMVPMACAVPVAGMWWFFPTAAVPFISAIVFVPVFIYPYVSWTWCCYAHCHSWPWWPYMHIDLCRTPVCTASQRYNKDKKYPLHVFHIPVFFWLQRIG